MYAPPNPFAMAGSPALTCPRCDAPAQAAATVQACARCAKPFTLRAGPRLDAQVVPPPYDPRSPRIIVKSAGVVLLKRGMLAPEGVSEGTLDPITGMVPMDQSGVLYPDVVSIAVYRKVDVVRIVAACLLPLPLSLLCVYGAVATSPVILAFGLPFYAIFAYMLWRALGLKANLVRVVGVHRTITVRFDSPLWRRQKFHDELLRRAGVSPSRIP